MSTILIGVDSTARSEDAVALARRLALAGPSGLVVASVAGSEPGRDDAHLAVRRMSGLLDGVETERIRTGVMLARSPAQGLHELAEAERAALLIVGSTHTGHLGRVRPGATGERLLHGAPCAVAVAPHGYRTRRDRPIARVGVSYDGSPERRVARGGGARRPAVARVVRLQPAARPAVHRLARTSSRRHKRRVE